jgi:biotin carboxyl carrier protein
MRRYTIEVGGKTYAVEVQEQGPDRFEVRLDGDVLDVRLLEESEEPGAAIAPDMDRALSAPASRRTRDERPPSPRGPPPPAPTQTGAAVPPAPLARPGLSNTAAVTTSRTLTAPMPGAIASIEVTAGARVARGDVLLTLEAMKMLNPIRAPRDAVASEVLVRQGQTVAFGDPLVSLEG